AVAGRPAWRSGRVGDRLIDGGRVTSGRCVTAFDDRGALHRVGDGHGQPAPVQSAAGVGTVDDRRRRAVLLSRVWAINANAVSLAVSHIESAGGVHEHTVRTRERASKRIRPGAV